LDFLGLAACGVHLELFLRLLLALLRYLIARHGPLSCCCFSRIRAELTLVAKDAQVMLDGYQPRLDLFGGVSDERVPKKKKWAPQIQDRREQRREQRRAQSD
jgi:hypothetical protein